jgi:hypothetical protein
LEIKEPLAPEGAVRPDAPPLSVPFWVQFVALIDEKVSL